MDNGYMLQAVNYAYAPISFVTSADFDHDLSQYLNETFVSSVYFLIAKPIPNDPGMFEPQVMFNGENLSTIATSSIQVPEPSSLALMLLGIMVGYALLHFQVGHLRCVLPPSQRALAFPAAF